MKIHANLPFDHTFAPQEFLSMQAVTDIVQTVEHAGFHGANVTDHPCPTARWLDAGGHDAQDPFVMLSLVAAVSTKLRLQTGILVLPYRNPFIVARAAATLDVFSGGRLTLSMGAGYLKGEYFALGADFERRNEIMDEYLNAMKAAWTGEEFSFEGTGYSARGNRIRPRPTQTPHPPLYIGGNSKRALRRVVELADGWNPFFTYPQLSTTARTTAMTNEADLAECITYLREHCEKVGRSDMPKIFLEGIAPIGEKWSPQQLVDQLGKYTTMGITGVATHIEGHPRAEWRDNAERFGADVIAKIK